MNVLLNFLISQSLTILLKLVLFLYFSFIFNFSRKVTYSCVQSSVNYLYMLKVAETLLEKEQSQVRVKLLNFLKLYF